MKKRFYLFGIAVLVTAIVFLMAGCDLFGDDYDMLNGEWDRGDIIITFNDNNGVFTQINSNSGWHTLLNNGTVRIGDRKFRNLKSSGNLKWTGQELTYLGSNTSWENTTLTISGQTLRVETVNVSNPISTYTRR